MSLHFPNKKINTIKGFTLIELVVVIVLLGIMSVGITSFINLSTQIYVNVADRDELIASARFAVERLNRELRNALPNSVRVKKDDYTQCIEFIPIKASTIYTDIPVSPEPDTVKITVVKFQDEDGNVYQCSANCDDKVTVYPLNFTDVYVNDYNRVGKMFALEPVDYTGPSDDEWILNTENPVVFDSDSPTNRLYIIHQSVSYCVSDAGNSSELLRYESDIAPNQLAPPKKGGVLMASNLAELALVMADSDLPFVINPATLQRNANVQVKLHFQREGEDFVFNNEIHLVNVP
ncbi:MAG: type II secretion system GspH family protein [Colwellia sp.]|nr:type II secretion system GspH family protein [Colwellia sp.]